jgi:primosomal protein N'
VNDVKIKLNNRIIKRLRNEFEGRLIVIDEFHNIRKTDDNENKKVAINLELLVKSAQNLRFLLLSATPMYNSYKEIIWLLNLMNTNDRRSRIEVKDIFDKNGNFKKDEFNQDFHTLFAPVLTPDILQGIILEYKKLSEVK